MENPEQRIAELEGRIAAMQAAAAVEPIGEQNLSAFSKYLNSMEPERKAALKKAMDEAPSLRKDATTSGITVGTGLTPYSLRAPADLLFPVVTPFVNTLPRIVQGGTGFNWKRITSVDAVEQYGFVAEPTDTTANSTAGRAGFNQFTEVDASVTFKTLGLDSYVTEEARYGGNTNTNSGMDFRPDQVARLGALQALRMREEKAILGSNATAIGNVANIALAADQPATGVGSLANSTQYDFQVTALTLLGYRLGSKGNAGGGTDSLGETSAAAATGLSTTAGGNPGDKSLNIVWTAKPRAIAYNVYAAANPTSPKYQATVTVNKYTLSALGSSTRVVNTLDKSADSNGFDGIYPLLAVNGGYVLSLDGAALSGTKNYIAEFDTAFQNRFVNTQTGPTRIFMGAALFRKAIDIVTGSTAPYMRLDATAGQQNILGGLSIRGVLNPYTQQPVDFVVHPYLPDGCALLWCDNLGQYYPNANIPNPIEMRLKFDYLNVDFARTSLRQEFGIYVSGAPTLRAGFPLGLIQNIG